MSTRQAAVYYGVRDIRLEEVPTPQIKDREVLIKCRAAAICGTDLRIYNHGHSKIPAGKTFILGHELAGDVVDPVPKDNEVLIRIKCQER